MLVPRLCVAWIALVATIACVSPPAELGQNAQNHANSLLAPYPDKQALSQFVGAGPALCIQSTTDTELCEWRAGNALPGWRPMAEAIDTGDRVNLVCELPLGDAPRSAGSCTIHPRRSNRYSWPLPKTGGTRGAKPIETKSEVKARYRDTANQWIEQARTLAELSRLMGAIPDQCAPGSEGELVCLWRTSDQTFGHGTLVVWIDASKSKKIRLRCAVPADGSPRARESCYAEVGA